MTRVGHKLVAEDGTLAGAAITMRDAVDYVVRTLEIPLAEALMMATLTPARLLGRQRPDRTARARPSRRSRAADRRSSGGRGLDGRAQARGNRSGGVTLSPRPSPLAGEGVAPQGVRRTPVLRLGFGATDEGSGAQAPPFPRKGLRDVLTTAAEWGVKATRLAARPLIRRAVARHLLPQRGEGTKQLLRLVSQPQMGNDRRHGGFRSSRAFAFVVRRRGGGRRSGIDRAQTSAGAAQRTNDRRRRRQGGGGDGGGGREALARAARGTRRHPRRPWRADKADSRRRGRAPEPGRRRYGGRGAKSCRRCMVSPATISSSRSSPAAGRPCSRFRPASSRSPTSRRSPARCSRAARASAK